MSSVEWSGGQSVGEPCKCVLRWCCRVQRIGACQHTDHKEGIEHDNEDVVLLKPEYFKIHALCQGHLLIEGHKESILAKIRKSKDLGESVVKAIEELKKSSTKQL